MGPPSRQQSLLTHARGHEPICPISRHSREARNPEFSVKSLESELLVTASIKHAHREDQCRLSRDGQWSGPRPGRGMLHVCPHPGGHDSGARGRQTVSHCALSRKATQVRAAGRPPPRCPARSSCRCCWHCLADNLRVLQDKSLYHPVSGSCMDCSESDHRIFMNICNPSSPTQQWLFEHTNSSILEKFNSN